MPAVKTTTLDALYEAQITGHRLVLPNWMDRQQYKSVDQVLRNLGGTWSRYEKAHVFAYNPTEAINQVLADGQAPGPPSREEGSVPTPPDLARRILRECTDIGDWDEGIILEPSAGAGALVQAIGEETGWSAEVGVVAIEPNGDRAMSIPRWQCPVYTGRLEEFLNSSPDLPREFDAVVANPPFALPSRPTAWIEHTWHAWSLLKPGGRLVSIAPKGLSFRTDRKHRELRALIERHGGNWSDLETGAFAQSGTQVNAVVFWLDKPHDWAAEQDRPVKKRGKPSEEEKQERRDEDRELKAAVDEALEDPEFADDLAARINATPVDCRLKHYSPRNAALVFAQADALGVRVTGHVNTFKGWAEQGRMVIKGSTGLRIVAAMGEEPEQDGDPNESEDEKQRKRFRVTTRFEFSQTKAIDDDQE